MNPTPAPGSGTSQTFLLLEKASLNVATPFSLIIVDNNSQSVYVSSLNKNFKFRFLQSVLILCGN